MYKQTHRLRSSATTASGGLNPSRSRTMGIGNITRPLSANNTSNGGGEQLISFRCALANADPEKQSACVGPLPSVLLAALLERVKRQIDSDAPGPDADYAG